MTIEEAAADELLDRVAGRFTLAAFFFYPRGERLVVDHGPPAHHCPGVQYIYPSGTGEVVQRADRLTRSGE